MPTRDMTGSFFLLAESHDHSTMNCIMAAIGSSGKILPQKRAFKKTR